MISKKEGIRRLLILADHLESIPRDEAQTHFDMHHWFTHMEAMSRRPFVAKKFFQSCGTSACALGIATLIPEFKALGLGLDRTIPMFIDHDGPRFGFGAAEAFFGLNRYAASKIFSVERYSEKLRLEGIMPWHVAATIREIVADAKRMKANIYFITTKRNLPQ
jgi:hypothetical protein